MCVQLSCNEVFCAASYELSCEEGVLFFLMMCCGEVFCWELCCGEVL